MAGSGDRKRRRGARDGERKPRWGAVVIEAPQALADELVGRLGQDSLGVETVPRSGESCLLKIYTSGLDEAAALAGRAVDVLRTSGLDPVQTPPRVEGVEDGRWVERYQAGLAPFPVGGRFIVEPSGERSSGGGRIPVILSPGRAFGTGEHETTQLCVAALERWVRAGQRWLDLGTGSGILAVVALRLGAAKVIALDTDPEAIEVARTVLEANRLSSRAELRVGSTELVAPATFEGVVANINVSYFLHQARELATSVRPGGVVIVSGFLIEDRGSVEQALARAGLCTIEDSRRDPWLALVTRRAAPS